MVSANIPTGQRRKFLYRSRIQGSLTMVLFILPVAGVVSSAPAWSQTVATSGTIQGSITDPAGAVVPGATITITNTGTHAFRTFTADGRGFYVSGPLIPGDYQVKVTAPGFSTVSATTVVQVGTTTSGNIKLEV